MKRFSLLQTALTFLFIGGISTLLYLYTSGYRFRKDPDKNIDVEQTGMISAKSLPEGANVYLDGKLVTATDDTISGVSQGLHNLRIVKKGFVEWEKNIEVYKELVTDITAILVTQSARIEPLTTTGARNPVISPSLKQIAYFSNDNEQPGVWVIPLSNGLTFFKANPSVVLEDTKFTKYSNGTSMQWSPDEKSLLIQGEGDTYFLLNVETNTAETVVDPEDLKKEWYTTLKNKRDLFIDKLELEDEIDKLARSSDVMWAPDEKKFLYTIKQGNKIQYKVYNMEDPLPIGELRDNLIFETVETDPQPTISWYSDSFHLLLVRGNVDQDKAGKISIIRIDGTNETEIYNSALFSNTVYSSPNGDKVIILTTFKSGDQTDLYTISLR